MNPQPLGPADIFTRTFGLWAANWWPMAKAQLVVMVPWMLVFGAIFLIMFPIELLGLDFKNLGEARAGPPLTSLPDPTLLVVLYVVLMLISVVAAAVVYTAAIQQAGDAAVGREPTPGRSLRAGWSRTASFALIYVMAMIGLSVGLILLILPGIWLAIAWAVVLPALVFEDARGITAFKRSFALVKDRWWATFGAILMVGLIVYLGLLVLSLPAGATILISPVVYLVSIFLVMTFASALALPMGACLLTVIYLDLRLRREGVAPVAEGDSEIGWQQVYAPPAV